MVKQNDVVTVAGKTARVQAVWSAGAHKNYILDDGRAIVDLDKLIEAGKATIVQASQTETRSDIKVIEKKVDFRKPWQRDDE